MPRIIASLSRLSNLLPLSILSTLFRSWPLAQVLVLRSFLHCPSAVFAALAMADDEMNTIHGLDTLLLNDNRHRIWLYFAEQDDWVGNQRENVLSAFEPDLGSLKVVHGHGDIPHAFCIRKSYVSLTKKDQEHYIPLPQITESNWQVSVFNGCEPVASCSTRYNTGYATYYTITTYYLPVEYGHVTLTRLTVLIA
jgi:hypothetical protein